MTHAITDTFEIRSGIKNKLKKYYARGYASFKGLDTYGTALSSKAMKKLASDLKTKDVKVGVQHNNALTDKLMNKLLAIKKELKLKGENTRAIDEALVYANKKTLPLGKPREVVVDENGVFVEVEINPYLRNLEPEYYDSIINMLEEQYLDGFSIEFDNPSIHDEYDSSGKRFKVIDNLDALGLEFVSGASNAGARITEVFCRMAGVDEEKKMEEKKEMVEKSKYDELLNKVEELTNKVNDLNKEKEVSNSEEEKLKQEAEELKKNIETQEKTFSEKLAEFELLLKESLNNNKLPDAKSLVKQEDKYAGETLDESQGNDVQKKIRKELEGKSMAELLKEAAEKNMFNTQNPEGYL